MSPRKKKLIGAVILGLILLSWLVVIGNNNVVNADVHQLDAKQIKKIQFKNDLFVITDPPRSGMDMKTIEALKRLKPGLILYISCNPFQLKKDILKFKDYQIKSAAMFDMFPQTNHIETVIELVRTD